MSLPPPQRCRSACRRRPPLSLSTPMVFQVHPDVPPLLPDGVCQHNNGQPEGLPGHHGSGRRHRGGQAAGLLRRRPCRRSSAATCNARAWGTVDDIALLSTSSRSFPSCLPACPALAACHPLPFCPPNHNKWVSCQHPCAGHPVPHRLRRAALLAALPVCLLLGHAALQVGLQRRCCTGQARCAGLLRWAAALLHLAVLCCCRLRFGSAHPPAVALVALLSPLAHVSPARHHCRSREKLFNIIIGAFLSFYAVFAFAYPHHDALHLDGMAATLSMLPSGMSGACGGDPVCRTCWSVAHGQRLAASLRVPCACAGSAPPAVRCPALTPARTHRPLQASSACCATGSSPCFTASASCGATLC